MILCVLYPLLLQCVLYHFLLSLLVFAVNSIIITFRDQIGLTLSEARIQILPTVWEDLVCSISSFLDSWRSWCVSHIFEKSKVFMNKLENA